jgi:hypothetical protein
MSVTNSACRYTQHQINTTNLTYTQHTLSWQAISVYNICLYEGASKATFKVQNIYSLLTANILISVSEPPTDICVAIQWAHAVCAAVACNTSIQVKPAALIQGRYLVICQNHATNFVSKFQKITLAYTLRLFLFLLSPIAGNLPVPSMYQIIRYIKSH